MTDGFDRTSNAAGPEPQPAYPTIDIAVFGAHLSGQPLNPSLLALGATRQRACLTAPTYRMLALSGPLPRPALCRVSRGGVGLPGEVWALPTSALAALLVSIAPPLGLGTKIAGGCTSGNGLSGNAMLSPASMVATMTFFVTGIAVNFLISAVI